MNVQFEISRSWIDSYSMLYVYDQTFDPRRLLSVFAICSKDYTFTNNNYLINDLIKYLIDNEFIELIDNENPQDIFSHHNMYKLTQKSLLCML